MDKKVTGILSYITFIGWLVAYLAGDKEGAKVHLNQGLILLILGIANWVIAIIPIVGWIISMIINIAIIVFTIMGIVYAATDKEELPIIGSIKILK